MPKNDETNKGSGIERKASISLTPRVYLKLFNLKNEINVKELEGNLKTSSYSKIIGMGLNLLEDKVKDFTPLFSLRQIEEG